MKRVYVAGAYSADNVLDVLGNIQRGIRMSLRVLLAGHAPFCPWLDFHYCLLLRDNESVTVQQFYAYSLAWLEVSDAMLVLPGYEGSSGTLVEIARAKTLGIPVYYDLHDLLRDSV
jgi:hypothetical protein